MKRETSQVLHQCPNCGCNLRQFEPIGLGNVRIDRAGDIFYEDRVVDIPRTQRILVEALIQARGRYLTRDVLANIVNSEISDVSICKYIERARSCFRKLNPNFDQIEALRGFGAYKWRIA